MKKSLLVFISLFVILFVPNFVNADESKANSITYDGQKLDIDNFIDNGRTYVDLNEFCKSKDIDGNEICKVEDEEDDTKKISIKITLNDNSYNYVTYHKMSSKEFTSMIEIGDETLENDVNTTYFKQDNIDVASCPNNSCDDGKFYVPIRFLTQGLGKTVTWDTEKMDVIIESKLEDNFNSIYDVNITDKTYSDNSKIEDELQLINDTYFIEKDKDYYMYVTDKETKKTVDNIKVIKKFNKNDNIKLDGNKINIDKDNLTDALGLIVVHKVKNEGTSNNGGSFPIVLERKFSTKKQEDKKYTYISLGDSLAAGLDPNLNPGNGFSDFVKDYLEGKNKLNYYTKEFAVSGYKTNNLISDIENNVSKEVNGETRTIQGVIAESDIITVSIGANDFTHTLLGDENGDFNTEMIKKIATLKREDMINVIDKIIPNVQKVIQLIKKYNSDCSIILLGFYNPIPTLYKINPDMVEEVFKYGNEEIDRIAKEENIYTAHFYEEFKENPDYLPNTFDIHPSQEGYQTMANKIIEVIESNIIEK